MKYRLAILLAFVAACVAGCTYNDGKWEFDPFELFWPEDKSYLPHGHPDRFGTDTREYMESGYGFPWDKDKKK